MFDAQAYALHMSWNKSHVLWVCTRGFGKALDLNTPIPTPSGFKLLNDIHEGDFVFGDDGKPTKVIRESPIYINHDCYQICFQNGEKIVADADHIWSVLTSDGGIKDITTQKMFSAGEHYSLPVNKAVEYDERKYKVHPHQIGRELAYGDLDNFDEEYCVGSIEQRVCLLCGLVFDCGEVDKSGVCYLELPNIQVEGFSKLISLIESLGFKILADRTSHDEELKQGQIAFKSSEIQSQKIISITPVKSRPVKCLMVDNESSRFLCGKHYTVTHNSTMVDVTLMLKEFLCNNYWAYIASGSGDQAITTFKTLENIVNRNIESMTGLSSVFKQEIVVNGFGDGFVHNPAGYYYELYNGSSTKTLNSNVDKKRGARGNAVVFD